MGEIKWKYLKDIIYEYLMVVVVYLNIKIMMYGILTFLSITKVIIYLN